LIPVGIVILFAAVITSSQQRPSYEADLRRGVKTDSTFVQQLEGNVILRQNDIVINCNTANYYPNTNISILTGNVKLTQESLTLYSDRLVYDGNTKVSDSPGTVKIVDGATVLTAENGIYFGDPKVAIFRDEVSIEDDSVKIDSDYIRYEKISGNSFGYGDVEIKGKFSNTQLYTDSVEYYPDEFYTLAIGNPILLQIDTVGVNPDYVSMNTESNSPATEDYPKFLYDTLTVSADTMQAYRTPYDEHFFFQR
jgi:lipopolysaccharide assembly outer membrane protein LptD (OstA)